MITRFSRRHALCLLAAIPAACASPNPMLYTLAVEAGPVRRGAPARIELRAIALARYLDRSEIVRSSEDFRLDVLGHDWWGEPLDAMLGRVLVQDLSQRLPESTVFSERGAVTATPDASIELNVQRLDIGRSGAMLLLAQIGVIRSGRTVIARDLRFSVPVAGPGAAALVAAMSRAVADLADAIAGLLVAPARR
jgi:uncharacterized lipoprotein YmbA